jgi:hypothetical protein
MACRLDLRETAHVDKVDANILEVLEMLSLKSGNAASGRAAFALNDGRAPIQRPAIRARRMRERFVPKPWEPLAWSTLVAITLVLATLLQAFASSALVAHQSTAPSSACLTPELSTVALADGDDVRARFLTALCRETAFEAREP